MASRKHLPPAYEGRPLPASGLLRHGPPLPAGHRSVETYPPQILGNRLAVQDAEIEQLTDDNRRLSATYGAFKKDLAAAQNEIRRLSDHIRSMREESDIEIRSMLDKIKNMELEIKAGENFKRDLHDAHVEARRLALDRQELTSKIHLASRELDKARADVKRLPVVHAELDSLRQEHQSLRETFEYEKGLNIKKVEQMRAQEKDIVGMAGEVERLKMEVANAEQGANAPPPYAGPYFSQTAFYTPSSHGNTGYADNFSRPPIQMDTGTLPQGMPPYGSSALAFPSAGVGGDMSGGYPTWYATYDVSHGSR